MTITEEALGRAGYELLIQAAAHYPKNYLEKILLHFRRETNPAARSVLASILRNIILAAGERASLCQDTGLPVFEITLNPGVTIRGNIGEALTEAVVRATRDLPIRKNVVEPFSLENSGTNAGWGVPFLHYRWENRPGPLRLRAELKGFGGETKSSTDWIFTSTESVGNAVLAYVLNNVILSRGEGCMPGTIGVGVGGYAAEAAAAAKDAVFRDLSDKTRAASADPFLRRLEERICRCVNRLGLGPMGGGGDTTTMGVCLERRGTHTAALPVSVSQQCWASRAAEAALTPEGITFLTPRVDADDVEAVGDLLDREMSAAAGMTVHRLRTPVPDRDVLKLRVGDAVYVSGVLCTAREGAHRRMAGLLNSGRGGEIPGDLRRHRALYHCGPTTAETSGGWTITAAGPTTSSRYTDEAALLVEKGVINLIVGKGVPGGPVVEALKGRGVFLNAVGGCAVSYRRPITGSGVEWLDLGFPEAVWIMEVRDFGPLVVGMDSRGGSLPADVMETVHRNARTIFREEGLDPERRYIRNPQTFAGLSLEEVFERLKNP